MSDPQDQDKGDRDKPGWFAAVASVAASFFGVQSSKNRKRDFTKGKASHFIAVGILMTLLFILTVWMAVKLALHSAGM